METTSKKWKGKFILFWKWLSYREDLQIFWYVSCGSVKRLRGIEKHHAGLRSVSIYSRNNHSLHMLNDMGYRVLMYCSSLKLIIKYATTQENNYKVLRGKWPKDRSLSIFIYPSYYGQWCQVCLKGSSKISWPKSQIHSKPSNMH